MVEGPPPLMPDRVQVGPFSWRVIHDASLQDDESYGCTRPSQLEIAVRPAPLDLERESLNHEILHACCFVAGFADTTKLSEEAFVGRVSPIYLDTLRRDKDLRDYLFS